MPGSPKVASSLQVFRTCALYAFVTFKIVCSVPSCPVCTPINSTDTLQILLEFQVPNFPFSLVTLGHTGPVSHCATARPQASPPLRPAALPMSKHRLTSSFRETRELFNMTSCFVVFVSKRELRPCGLKFKRMVG
jgi:hypothetical protein